MISGAKPTRWRIGLITLLGTTLGWAEGATQRVEVNTYPVAPGDTLIVENDYGRVQVQEWDSPQLEIRTRSIAPDAERLKDIFVLSHQSGDKVFLRVYFYNYSAESVYVEVKAPRGLNLVIWGANPAVELSGLHGYVRAATLTGLITAENLGSSASLLTESGDILYRSTEQPSGDIRLESTRGNIECRLQQGLNLRGWLRAGKTLSWNQEIELTGGHLEKQVGIGGPLLLATSLQGDVRLHFDSSLRPQADFNPPRMAEPPQTRPGEPSTPPRTGNPDLPSPEAASRVETAAGSGEVSGDLSPSAHSAPAVHSGYSLKVNVEMIHLHASVWDRYTHRSVPHLKQEDFLVYENNVLQEVEKFQTTEAPFNLLLLLDVSGSTRSYLDLIKRASSEFTRQIKENDRIGLAVFNSRSRLLQPFTNDRQEVQRAIDRIRSGGGTAFYDALSTSIRDYMQGLEGRKAIVVFSDGVDNQLTGDYSHGSQTTFPDLFREIQEIDTLIYTIFLDTEDRLAGAAGRSGGLTGVLIDILSGGTPPLNSRGPRSERAAYAEARRQLALIAEQTGARMYSPNDIRDLSHVYSEIADDLRIQYTLGYHSSHPSQDGRWRSIEVRIRNQPDLVVRTRKGYYSVRS